MFVTNEAGVDHPAQFPVALAEGLIQTFCPAGGTVLDTFSGSGSTLVAAKRLGRDYYGFDIMSEYCQTARRRLAAVHNRTALPEVG
jgi:site-specific DNA-methyltransferase (adenine-specific)